MTGTLSTTLQVRKPAVESEHGLVASQSRVASEIGAGVLSRGGNAVDAAIATSFALGAAEPWMSGVGGGGYMIMRRAGDADAQVIDFGMRAPGGLNPADYPLAGGRAGDLFAWPAVYEDRNVLGPHSVAVPGQVAGMALAHEHFATLPWPELVRPAAERAAQGLTVDWYCQLVLASAAGELAKFPASKDAFLNEDGFPRSSAWTALGSTRCPLTNLAATLDLIAEGGADAFYRGPVAHSMVKDLQAAGACHTLADFDAYEARLVTASRFAYRDHLVFGTPDLTAGPTLERVFSLLKDWTPGARPDADAFAGYARAIRQAYAERYETMGDTQAEPVPSCTTHFNVVDADGTMVAVTQTLLSMFGSRMMLPESGVLMNNGIMWFDPEPGKPNSLGPGKRCLTNMCPTLLEREDGTRFAVGAAGGRKIMPAVAQLTSFLLDYGMDLDAAIHEPRIDVSLPDAIIADEAMASGLLDALTKSVAGVQVAPRTVYPFNFACPSAVSRHGAVNRGVTEVMSPWSDCIAAHPG